MGIVKQLAAAPRAPDLQLLTGCTIARTSEVPQALVLAASFLKFHVESHFAILVLDSAGKRTSLTQTTLLFLGDLGLAPGEHWRLPMLYGPDELLSILKPALLRNLLQRGAIIAAFFEVSTEIFGSMTDVWEVIEADEDIFATEAVRTALGAELDPSFIAARRGTEKTLFSWFERMQTPISGSGTSARIDSGIPPANPFASIPHCVIRPPGFALGYWNLNPETFAWNGERYEIDGGPLRSFDFRGYDPAKPHLLSVYQGAEPEILLSAWPAIGRICEEYQNKVVEAGYDKRPRVAYRFDYLTSGVRIDRRMHQLYRQANQKHKLGLDREPPSPFAPGGEEEFLAWLNEPVGSGQKRITRYMLAVYEERDDVRKAFPDPTGVDAAGFHDWYRVFGQAELNIPAVLVPLDAISESKVTHRGAASPITVPVNVAGYFKAELGLGTAARSLLAALEALEIPFNTVMFEGTANRQTHSYVPRQAGTGSADINIVCINADQLPAFAQKTGPELWAGRYTIGLWFWEVEDFPEIFHGAFNYVDEVWVASEFMRETFLKVSPKPVFKLQLPVLRPEINPSLSRADVGLPDRFVFLFSFDLFSVLERKNPVGLIQAFARAFKADEGPVLVIKTINGDKRVLEMEKLHYASRGRPDIILRDGYLSPVETNTLTALADCYVSLHRSEGFGLTIAEAMALGKPTIATAYSGNLEFMNEENSYLCRSQRVKVGPDHEPYPADSYWSEPDLGTAARLLRHVYEQREEARARGVRAASDIRSLHTPGVAAAVISARIATIRRRRAAPGPQRSIAFLEERVEELEAEIARLRAL